MANTGKNRRDFLKLAGGACAVAALPSSDLSVTHR